MVEPLAILVRSGNMDTAIAIRTAVIKGGVMHIQAGAGLVADSSRILNGQKP